ncbi:MAG: hypothetical protein ABR555_11505 [Pyrinomonadaceae bacterium]
MTLKVRIADAERQKRENIAATGKHEAQRRASPLEKGRNIFLKSGIVVRYYLYFALSVLILFRTFNAY